MSPNKNYHWRISGYYFFYFAFVLDEHGELLPKFRPAPMAASFMLDPALPAPRRQESIPVPKGPVDTW